MALTEHTPILSRGLSEAQKAFESGDTDASREAHVRKNCSGHQEKEEHDSSGEFVKAAVFGGLDGILTSFGVVAGAVGGGLPSNVILIVGFSNLIAGAISMGCGEYLSNKAEAEYTAKERQREAWEMQAHPEGEITEMVDIYVGRGMSQEDATQVVTTLAKYENLFVDIMMAEELGLMQPKPGLFKFSAVIFVSFIFFGSIPLLNFACLPAHYAGWEMTAAVAVTVLALGALGSIKARFGFRAWWSSSGETILLGSICALVAFLVGNFVEGLTPAPDLEVLLERPFGRV